MSWPLKCVTHTGSANVSLSPSPGLLSRKEIAGRRGEELLLPRLHHSTYIALLRVGMLEMMALLTVRSDDEIELAHTVANVALAKCIREFGYVRGLACVGRPTGNPSRRSARSSSMAMATSM